MTVVSFSDCYFYSASYYTSTYEYVLPGSFSASFPSNLSSGVLLISMLLILCPLTSLLCVLMIFLML